MTFIKNNLYTRTEIRNLVNDPGRNGKWTRGYLQHNEEYYIFANIGGESYTGVNHNNKWIDDQTLSWNGMKKSSIDNPEIQRMISEDFPVHLFTRDATKGKDDLKGKPFTYHGEVVQVGVKGKDPVNINWRIK